jgi:hypothetical protein
LILAGARDFSPHLKVVVNFGKMRRLFAIVAMVALLSSPAAVWTSAGCCDQPDCCANGLCPMHRATVMPQPAADKEEQGMHCHAAKKGQTHSAPGCVAGASCSHPAKGSLLAPLPRAVMAPAVSLSGPVTSRVSHPAIAPHPVSGFLAPPFIPPRLFA